MIIKILSKIAFRDFFFLLLLVMLVFTSVVSAAPDTEPTPTLTPTPAAAIPAEPQIEHLPVQNDYTLKIFAQDAVLRNPNSTAYGYVSVQPGTTIVEPVIFDLWYSYSPTVRPDISTMTVSLNGVPVSSRILESNQSSMVNWQVSLPAQDFRTGVNEIAVSVVHRTIDGLCRDIDNDANWFIIRPDTRLSFRAVHAPYSLAGYPAPFLNSYLASKINTVFYMPSDADKTLLASLLNMATALGAESPAGVPERLEVRFGQPEQIPANEVVFGLTDSLFPGQPFSKDDAVLKFEQLANGHARLLIAGADYAAISKAVSALNRPTLVKTFLGRQVVLSAPLAEEAVNIATITSAARAKKGVYTLADLVGQDDITIAGAFHQQAFLTIQRPPNYGIGDGSYIELHFRHARILDPKKSAVTVYINEIPIRSAVLSAENAERGVLKVPIPETELDLPLWNVRIGCYHDLGIIDCSKRYDEVAWTVIDKKTNVYLAPGKVKLSPDLENFPNNFFVGANGVINLTMLLPDNLSQEEVNAAFKLAYFIGSQNQTRIIWNVQTASSYDLKKAPGSVIALGKSDQPEYWRTMKEYLAVFPEAEGRFTTASWLDVLPQVMNLFDIYQVAKIDNNEDKLLYAFMYSEAGRVSDLLNIALLRGHQLKGQVSLVDAGGNLAAFKQKTEKQEKSAYLKIYEALFEGNAISIYAIVFAAVIILTLALTFFMYKTNRR